MATSGFSPDQNPLSSDDWELIDATEGEVKSELRLSEPMRPALLFSHLPKALVASYKEGEHFAHTVAYQLQRNPEIKSHHYGSAEYHVHKVDKVAPGLVAYILTEENHNLHQPKKVRLLFRGTKDLASLWRDAEPLAAGALSFDQSVDAINKALGEKLGSMPEAGIALSIEGHSLGAADAQRMYVDVMQKIYAAHTNPDVKDIRHYTHIRELSLFCCNSPGVSKSTIDHASEALIQLNSLELAQRPKLVIRWLHAAGDLVQSLGEEGHILHDAKCDEVEITLVKTHASAVPDLFAEKIWQTTFNLYQAVAALLQVWRAHCSHYFNHENNKDTRILETMRYAVLKNNDPLSIALISNRLQKRIKLPAVLQQLQYWLMSPAPASEVDEEGYTVINRDSNATYVILEHILRQANAAAIPSPYLELSPALPRGIALESPQRELLTRSKDSAGISSTRRMSAALTIPARSWANDPRWLLEFPPTALSSLSITQATVASRLAIRESKHGGILIAPLSSQAPERASDLSRTPASTATLATSLQQPLSSADPSAGPAAQGSHVLNSSALNPQHERKKEAVDRRANANPDPFQAVKFSMLAKLNIKISQLETSCQPSQRVKCASLKKIRDEFIQLDLNNMEMIVNFRNNVFEKQATLATFSHGGLGIIPAFFKQLNNGQTTTITGTEALVYELLGFIEQNAFQSDRAREGVLRRGV